MSPEERDRLAKVEQILEGQKATLAEIKEVVDRLEALANMGKGALGLFLKAGAVLTVIVGALAWVYEKFVHRVGS